MRRRVHRQDKPLSFRKMDWNYGTSSPQALVHLNKTMGFMVHNNMLHKLLLERRKKLFYFVAAVCKVRNDYSFGAIVSGFLNFNLTE